MNKLLIVAIILLIFTKSSGQNQELEPYEQKVNNNILIKMMPIPAGSMLIGSGIAEKGRQKDEGPQVKVEFQAFWMGATEITHDQFMAFRFEEKDLDPKPDAISRPTAQYIDLTWGMGKEGGFPANSMQPYAAIAYCKWLWKKTGIFYRLPTEAEWEYAASAGKKSVFGDGTTAQNIKNYAWFTANSASKYHQVGKKMPNKWGLYDMMGNVAEWTMDMYVDNYFEILKKTALGNTYIKRDNFRAYHTAKGGGFKNSINELRLADRQPQTENWNKRDPQIPRSKWWLTDGESVGFRIVRPALQPSAEEIEQFFIENLELGL
jgi:formylglycine-generating enzyme required for sulfatase activity